MLNDRSVTGRFLGLFLLGCFLFSYPVLTIFNLPAWVLGIPLFFFYLFTAWLVLVLLVFAFERFSDAPDPITLLADKETIKEKEK